MAVLFLDPLVLLLSCTLLVYSWVVWRGWFRRWLGRSDGWTVLAWPLPLLVILVPAVVGGSLSLLGLVGLDVTNGGAVGAGIYTVAYLGPFVALTVWPPRWLLPGWARVRLTALSAPDTGAPQAQWPGMDASDTAVPAAQVWRGHGSLARWAWQVDAVPGVAWVDGDRLRFQAADALADGSIGHLDDEALAEFRFSASGELRLEPPRGGSWGRTSLDVDLPQLDRVAVSATRPWRRDGLVTLEVDGRRPAHLWVADVRAFADRLDVPRP